MGWEKVINVYRILNMKPKKQFGQNFLTQPKIAQDLVNAGEITKKDTILEIGPGKGMLTEKLLATGAHVIAVEKDSDLIEELKTKFHKEVKNKRLTIINADILNFETKKLITKKYKLIANIPYYITGIIIRKFLESNHQPTKMVLMVQKEVAERIVARDKKESILSISVKVYGEPKIIKKVSAGSFFPKPNVDSAILLIDNISKDNFVKNKIDENTFFEIIKKGFKSPRKQLNSNLKNDSTVWKNICAQLNITEAIRPENLTTGNWVELVKNLRIF